MQYFHRVDPKITREAAYRLLGAAVVELSKLRPKAKTKRLQDIELMKADIAEIERGEGRIAP